VSVKRDRLYTRSFLTHFHGRYNNNSTITTITVIRSSENERVHAYTALMPRTAVTPTEPNRAHTEPREFQLAYFSKEDAPELQNQPNTTRRCLQSRVYDGAGSKRLKQTQQINRTCNSDTNGVGLNATPRAAAENTLLMHALLIQQKKPASFTVRNSPSIRTPWRSGKKTCKEKGQL